MLSCLGSLAFRLLRWAGGEHLDELHGVDAVLVVNDHLGEGVIHLLAAELFSPGHEGMSQVLAVNVAASVVKGLESVDDHIVVIGT